MEISIDELRRALEKINNLHRNIAEKRSKCEILQQQLLEFPENFQDAQRFDALRLAV